MQCAACNKELERASIREEREGKVLRFCSVACFQELLGGVVEEERRA
ncbi:MAG: hypothetical protein ACE5JE_05400 [Thermoplasmata archaeon]